jgi:hypothetical protein
LNKLVPQLVLDIDRHLPHGHVAVLQKSGAAWLSHAGRQRTRARTDSTKSPKEWPADREQRARYIGEWLRAEAHYLAS